MRWLFLLILSGCGGPGVTLSPDRASYGAGEKVTLTLENRTLGRAGYNLCFSQLHGVGVGTITDRDGTACSSELRSLAGGASATGTMRALPAGLTGSHFYRTSIEDPDGKRVELDSATFEVTP